VHRSQQADRIEEAGRPLAVYRSGIARSSAWIGHKSQGLEPT
jgi:hypothetical protein